MQLTKVKFSISIVIYQAEKRKGKAEEESSPMPKTRIPEVLLIISKKQTPVLKGGLDGTDGGGHCSSHLTWCRLLKSLLSYAVQL